MLTKRLQEHRILLLLGAAAALMHLLLNGQYGFHRDELDILMNARQLDWGYVAYPPFTPFIARLGLALFGSSLPGLRLFSALGQGLAVVLIGWMARDLGGDIKAQVMAAAAAAVAPVALVAGTMIQYMAFDYLWWIVIAFCFVRLLKTEEPRWWLGVGAGIGMGMMTKYTAAFFVAGWVAAILLTPNRRYLCSAWLWAGAGLAVLIFLPNLVWQVQHDFISLDFLSAIHDRDIEWGRTDNFLIEQLFIANNPLTLPLWVAGLVLCLFAPTFKPFRLLGIAFLVTFGLLWLSRGRAYYVGPAYTMLLAAGAAGWQTWMNRRSPTVRKMTGAAGWALLTTGAVLGVVLVKPVVPINSELWKITSDVNGEVIEMVGWEDLTAQVAEIYNGLPENEKPDSAILAGNYGEAGALDFYGPAYHLPTVISGANSLWERGYRLMTAQEPLDPGTVIVVGFETWYAVKFFKSCKVAGRVTNRYGVRNEETSRHNLLHVCRQPRRAWPELWQGMQWFQ